MKTRRFVSKNGRCSDTKMGTGLSPISASRFLKFWSKCVEWNIFKWLSYPLQQEVIVHPSILHNLSISCHALPPFPPLNEGFSFHKQKWTLLGHKMGQSIFSYFCFSPFDPNPSNGGVHAWLNLPMGEVFKWLFYPLCQGVTFPQDQVYNALSYPIRPSLRCLSITTRGNCLSVY